MRELFNYFLAAYTTSLSEMTGLQFIFLIVSIVVIPAALFFIFKYFFKWIVKPVSTLVSIKQHCQHIQCPTCGRTLDKCICNKNKHRGNLARLSAYYRERKEKTKQR